MPSSTSDSSNLHNPDLQTAYNRNPDPPNPDDRNQANSNQSSNQDEKDRISEEERNNGGGEGEGEEEEEGECGFCLFMKAGGCRDQFVAWEHCIEEAEKSKEDIVEKCFEVTSNLKKCMEAHSDYYEPILRAEKAAEEEAKQALEKKNDEQNPDSGVVEERVEIVVGKDD